MELLLVERIDTLKKMVVSHKESLALLTGQTHGRGFFQGLVYARESEVKFLEKLLGHVSDTLLTPDLMEEYGFIANEPGYYFCQTDDSPDLANIRIEQNLQHQNRWRLIHMKTDTEEEVVALAGLTHLLKVLEEKGIVFEDEDDFDNNENY